MSTISTGDSIKICEFAVSFDVKAISTDPAMRYYSPCASFAALIIEKATKKKIQDRDSVFQQNDARYEMSDYLGYNDFLICQPGSLLGVYAPDEMRILHYVIKLHQNHVIGVHHGGILLENCRMCNGFVSYCTGVNFDDNQFKYDRDPNCPPRYLVKISYSLG